MLKEKITKFETLNQLVVFLHPVLLSCNIWLKVKD